MESGGIYNSLGSGAPSVDEQSAAATGLSEKDKKVRNLEKKLRQIRELKERQIKGDTLEPTQVCAFKTDRECVRSI
jgi:uncharacterized protein with WD repeat